MGGPRSLSSCCPRGEDPELPGLCCSQRQRWVSLGISGAHAAEMLEKFQTRRWPNQTRLRARWGCGVPAGRGAQQRAVGVSQAPRPGGPTEASGHRIATGPTRGPPLPRPLFLPVLRPRPAESSWPRCAPSGSSRGGREAGRCHLRPVPVSLGVSLDSPFPDVVLVSAADGGPCS